MKRSGCLRPGAGALVGALAISTGVWGQPFPACDNPPPGAGDCLTPTNGVPGCLDHTCCETICTNDPFCCEVEWDQNCVDSALLGCTILLNDECADALVITLGEQVPFDTTIATTDGNTSLVCLVAGGFQIFNDIWYSFTPAQNNTYVASLCGSSFDTMLAVYHDFFECPPTIDPIGCNNNVCFNQSEVQFDGVAGQNCLIRVGSRTDGDVGPGVLTITKALPPVVNDECDGRILLTIGSSTIGSTSNATADPGAPSPCGTDVTAPGLWYSVIGTGNTITLSTCAPATNYNTRINVYCNTCTDLTCVGGNDNQAGALDPACDVFGGGVNLGSTFSFCSQLNREYLILVQGTAGDTGVFELLVTDSGGGCPDPEDCTVVQVPPNDDCANAASIALGDTPFSTVNATTDGPAHASCDNASGDLQVNQDVWFDFTAGFTGNLVVTTCDLVSYDSRIAVYDTADCASVDEATLLGCNDDDLFSTCGVAPDFHSTLLVSVVQGNTYKIRVGGFGTETGSGMLRLDAPPPHPNCPGTGDCHVPNGTPGCADQSCCDQVCTLVPDCCDVAWDQFCADAAVTICGAPPVCGQLQATCQLPDQAGHGQDFVVAVVSDSNPGQSKAAADNFVAFSDQQITEVCWWGIYAILDPPAPGDCAPGDGDNFTITYFNNIPGSPDAPGPVLAGPFSVTPLRSATGLTISSQIGTLIEFQYAAIHSPVSVTAGVTYWLQILNSTTGSCIWFWQTAPGDGLSHLEDPVGSGYGAGTDRDFDLAWCLDLDPPVVPCPWDCQAVPSGSVDVPDLLALLATWGSPGPCDLDGDGIVTVPDLLALLAHWGACP